MKNTQTSEIQVQELTTTWANLLIIKIRLWNPSKQCDIVLTMQGGK